MSGKTLTLEEFQPRIDRFLQPLLKAAGLDVSYVVEEEGESSPFISPDLAVRFEGREVDRLLAHRGEVLLALEQLTLDALRISHDDRHRILFDAHDYRYLRMQELRMSAEAAAEKVVRTGMPFRFNPMTSRERRILHIALRDQDDVYTTSEGEGRDRHTVVYPSKKD